MYSSRKYPCLNHGGQKKFWGGRGGPKGGNFQGGVLASEGLFSGGSGIDELLRTNSWASVEQAISYFTFKRRLTVFIDDLFLMGIPNQVGKNHRNSRGRWKFKAMGALKYKCPTCMWGVWIFFGTTQFQDKLVDVFLSSFILCISCM